MEVLNKIPSEGLQQNGIFAGHWRAKEAKKITVFPNYFCEYLKFASDKLFISLLINWKHFSFLGSFYSVFELGTWSF